MIIIYTVDDNIDGDKQMIMIVFVLILNMIYFNLNDIE